MMTLIVRFDPIKTESHLRSAIPYIMNKKKTNGFTYSNVGVTPDEITNAFFMTKERYKNKARGNREAYHVKFSFSKDSKVSPEQCLEYAKAWADEYLDSKYDYVVAVHNDRDHRHMHLIFNSVSITGEKFHMARNEVRDRVRPLTNKISKMFEIDEIRERDPKKDYSSAMSWKNMVEEDIDKCIACSKSYGDFKWKMKNKFGYTVREGVSREYGLYLALTPPGKAKAIRTHRLADGYMPADIEEKIAARKERVSLVWKKVRRDFIAYEDLSIYQKDFLRKAYAANSLYRKTGSTLHMHEMSVVALRRLKKEYKLLEREMKEDLRVIKEAEIRKADVDIDRDVDKKHIKVMRKERGLRL